MKCNNCGNEYEGNFCTLCGAKNEGTNIGLNPVVDVKTAKKKKFYKRWWFQRIFPNMQWWAECLPR